MKTRKSFWTTLILTMVFAVLVVVASKPIFVEARDYPARPVKAVITTEESQKVFFSSYVAYTDNAITISYSGVETNAYVTATKAQDLTGWAPDTSTSDTNFSTIDISGASTPTLCGVVDTINGYTGYSAVLVDGADCLLPAQDFVTSANQEVTSSHTFVYTASDNLGISKLIAAAGSGKKIYLHSITVSGTGTGAILVRVYDGYSTVKFSSVLASGTERNLTFPSPIVGSDNTLMVVRVTGASTLTAGYINAVGYTR